MSSWESQITPQEAKYFVKLFQQASKSQEGIVTGGEAVRFFATSGVPNEILSEVSLSFGDNQLQLNSLTDQGKKKIWEAADRDKVGYLTPETFSIALKLIACAQHGKEATEPVLATGKKGRKS